MSRWFLLCWYQNFYLLPYKLGFFGPKNGQIWSKICIFGHFGPNIAIFCTFCPMPDQKTIWTRCLGGFSVMWVTKLLFSPVKKGIFVPITTKFGPKLAFLVQFGPGHAGLFSALLVGRLVVVARGLYLARHLFTLGYFCLKNDQNSSKICIFGHFGPNIAIFCTFLSNAQPKTSLNKVPRWVFRYVGNKTFDFYR